MPDGGDSGDGAHQRDGADAGRDAPRTAVAVAHVVEANCPSCLTEITDGKTLTELTTVPQLTMAVTVPLLLPVSVDAD